MEADVVSEVQNVSVTFFECKGYQPAGVVSDQVVERWLTKTIPRLYDYARRHSEWKNLTLAFEFWTTGKLSEDARKRVDVAAEQIRPTKYTIRAREADQIREVAQSLQDNALLKIFNEHFFEHPLATAERKLERRYVRRPRDLARKESTNEGFSELSPVPDSPDIPHEAVEAPF